MATRRSTAPPAANGDTATYKHAHEATRRPDVGVQDQFTARKPPRTYRYDSSLDPALSRDENRDRELAEWLIALVQRCADISRRLPPARGTGRRRHASRGARRGRDSR